MCAYNLLPLTSTHFLHPAALAKASRYVTDLAGALPSGVTLVPAIYLADRPWLPSSVGLSWRLSRDKRQDLCDRKRPQKPKHIAIIAVLRSYLSPLFLLLGRDLCGDRILRSCLQKGPMTALANYAVRQNQNIAMGNTACQNPHKISTCLPTMLMFTPRADISEHKNNKKY